MQLRTPKEVTTEEYNEFYKMTFNEYLEPLASSHFTTEVKANALCSLDSLQSSWLCIDGFYCH